MSDVTSTSATQSSDRQKLLEELLAELMRAIDAGKHIETGEWIASHPEFASELREFFSKHKRLEQLVRPLRQALANALHVRCPHCHNPIELVEHAPLSEISCPSCGSCFSLVGEGPSHYPGGAKTIGHFQLLDRVGIGAFGSVWKARDTKLDRTVAVKIPRNGQLDETQTELFLRDARSAAQLKHPNIVCVHEIGKHNDTIYIVSDLIDGAPLKEWMASKHLTPREAAGLCIKIAGALHHAHESGVVHRDLKPGNIMMDINAEPHIVDFGLAKREAGEITMTVEGQILGTPAYMPPEQARGEGHTVDRRADIYSLGVILYELLTGELPFRGDKQMLIVQILKDDPPSPRNLNSSVPRDLETICLKCLEKDSSNRYSNATELMDDLDDFLLHRPIKTRPIGSTARFARWCHRNPLAATLFVVIGLAAACAAGMFVAVFYQAELTQSNKSLHVALASSNSAKLAADRERAEAKQAANLSRRYEYVSQIKLAQLALVEGRRRDAFLALEQLLPNEHSDDLRGFEWFYLWRKCGGPKHTIPGAGTIQCIAVSPDGHIAAVAYANRVVAILRLTSGELLARIQLDGAVLSLAFANDSMMLYIADGTGIVTSWSTKGQPVATVLNLGKALEEAHLTKAGELLVALAKGSDDLTIHRCQDGIAVYSGKYSRYTSAWGDQAALFAMNNDSNRLVSARAETVTVLDITSKDALQSHQLTKESSRRVGCIAISGDDKIVAAAESIDFKNSMPRRNESELTKGFRIKAWDLADGHELCSFIGHKLPIDVIAISHDQTRLATASRDETIKIWSLEKQDELIATVYGQTFFTALTFDPGGKHVLAGDDHGTLRIWELVADDTTLLLIGKGEIGEVVFINGGQRIVGGSNLWTLRTGQRSVLDFETTRGRDQRRIAVSSNERHVSGGANLVDLDNLSRTPGYQRQNWALDVAFNPAATLIATAETSVEICLAELVAGKEIRRFSFPEGTGRWTPWATSVAFSPKDNAILGSSGGTNPHQPGHIILWSLQSGQNLREFTGHGKSVWRVVFDREGNRIAAATGNYLLTDVDNDVWVWDTNTGKPLHVLKGHRECAFDVDFSPDGTRLASVSGLIRNHGRPNESPGELKIWDLQTGQELLTIENANAGFVSAAFDESGKQIAVGATDGTVTVFRPSFSP